MRNMAEFPLAIMPRESWGAAPPQNVMPLAHPCTYVFCMNTNSEECFNEFDCRGTIRRIQETHMTRKFFRDIRFNFIIGGDGNVYEGRGWLHSALLPDKYKDYNDSSVVIGFLGSYTEAELPPMMTKRRNELVKYGIEQKYIAEHFTPYEIFMKLELS